MYCVENHLHANLDSSCASEGKSRVKSLDRASYHTYDIVLLPVDHGGNIEMAGIASYHTHDIVLLPVIMGEILRWRE